MAIQKITVLFYRLRFLAVALCLSGSLTVMAETSFGGKVTSVELNTTSKVVTVTMDVPLSDDCGQTITFPYQPNRLSEIYYSMLLTAKSTGLKTRLVYDDNGVMGCGLTSVELSQW